jgi:hypothetical protein
MPIFKERETILVSTGLGTFGQAMRNRTFPFQYDHAVAITALVFINLKTLNKNFFNYNFL